MSKVITFSRTYPSYHPRAGEPTYFVEQIWSGLFSNIPQQYRQPFEDYNDYKKSILWSYRTHGIKHHTIRAGHRWKAGDWFSPRVWGDNINPKSGKKGPYHSNQITFAPDIQIKKVWDFDISGHDGKFFIDGSPFTSRGMLVTEIANNDGLTPEDFKAWFKHPKPFSGQIICWSDQINY